MMVPPVVFHSRLSPKRLTAHFSAAWLLGFRQLTFDNHLRGNPCVIGARLPRVSPPAYVSTDHDVLQVLLNAWPMCNTPVTLGGGIMMVNVSSRVAFARFKHPACSHAA